MYCSSCGAPVAEGLSYCNRCGANLKPAETSAHRPVGLAWLIAFGIAMMGTPIGGVALVSELIRVLLDRGIPFRDIAVLVVIMLAAVFGAVVMLTRLLSPLVKAYAQSGAQPVEAKAAELRQSAPPAQLEAPREPAHSVTENTTRAFEPIYREERKPL